MRRLRYICYTLSRQCVARGRPMSMSLRRIRSRSSIPAGSMFSRSPFASARHQSYIRIIVVINAYRGVHCAGGDSSSRRLAYAMFTPFWDRAAHPRRRRTDPARCFPTKRGMRSDSNYRFSVAKPPASVSSYAVWYGWARFCFYTCVCWKTTNLNYFVPIRL